MTPAADSIDRILARLNTRGDRCTPPRTTPSSREILAPMTSCRSRTRSTRGRSIRRFSAGMPRSDQEGSSSFTQYERFVSATTWHVPLHLLRRRQSAEHRRQLGGLVISSGPSRAAWRCSSVVATACTPGAREQIPRRHGARFRSSVTLCLHTSAVPAQTSCRPGRRPETAGRARTAQLGTRRLRGPGSCCWCPGVEKVFGRDGRPRRATFVTSIRAHRVSILGKAVVLPEEFPPRAASLT